MTFAKPVFLIAAEFLPHHNDHHHQQTLQIIGDTEVGGPARRAEMNRVVADNLARASVEADAVGYRRNAE